MLICIGGLPANGKTTIGVLLARLYGDKAAIVDPDLTRLEVQGRPLTDSIRDTDLTPEITQKTIASMKAKTERLLDEGKIVIVPSAFIGQKMRLDFEQIAKNAGVPFGAYWLEAPIETLHERAIDRQKKKAIGVLDATTVSNVGPDRIKASEIEGELTWQVVQSTRPRDQVLGDVMKHLPSPPPPREVYGPPVA